MRTAGVLSVGLALACTPAVPADTGVTSGGSASDDDLPPVTSGPLTSSQTGAPSDDTRGIEPLYDIGATSGMPPENPCEIGWPVDPLPPQIVFVVDLSGSMVTQFVDHDGDPKTPPTTRWHAVRTALEAELPQWDRSHEIGLRSFPSALAMAPPDLSACDPDGAAVVPSASGATAVLGALPADDDTTLAGAAPLRAAIYEARALLSPADNEPERAIVLITDGAPNCGAGDVLPDLFDQVDYGLLTVLSDSAQDGISSVIIAFDVPDTMLPGGNGEPIANPKDVLDSLAFGSLDSEARAAADTPDLQARLAELRTELRSRRVAIPQEIVEFRQFEMVIGNELYYAVNDCRDDGYMRIYGDGGDALQMCGTALAAFQRAGQASLWPFCIFPPD